MELSPRFLLKPTYISRIFLRTPQKERRNVPSPASFFVSCYNFPQLVARGTWAGVPSARALSLRSCGCARAGHRPVPARAACDVLICWRLVRLYVCSRRCSKRGPREVWRCARRQIVRGGEISPCPRILLATPADFEKKSGNYTGQPGAYRLTFNFERTKVSAWTVSSRKQDIGTLDA